ncbi:MAG: hypothetical protein JOZ34_09815 [Gammaproteobacteria bacterium]|nr:hypothetical protein [Gammaproteobacteria bacterium]
MLAADSLLQVRRISISLHLDARYGALDVAQLCGCQLNIRRCDIFLQPS